MGSIGAGSRKNMTSAGGLRKIMTCDEDYDYCYQFLFENYQFVRF
jgi:hypothetical protein